MLAEQGIYGLAFFLVLSILIPYAYIRSLSVQSLWIQLFLAFIFIGIDGNRKDLDFIMYLKEKGRYIVLAEYTVLWLLLELPFLFCKGVNYFMILPLAISLILVFSKWSTRIAKASGKINVIKSTTRFIPIHAFEWRSGIRRNKLFFCSSYFLGMVLLFFFPITPLFMFFWAAYSGEFYNALENKEIIQSYKTVENFEKRKLKSFFRTVNLLFLPHYLLYILLYHEPEHCIGLLFSILVFNMIFIYALMYKYKFVITGQKHVPNSAALSIFMFIVFIAPVSLYLIFNLWKQIKTNLKLYLR